MLEGSSLIGRKKAYVDLVWFSPPAAGARVAAEAAAIARGSGKKLFWGEALSLVEKSADYRM